MWVEHAAAGPAQTHTRGSAKLGVHVVEARVDADRMVLATRSALDADGDLLSPPERHGMEALIRSLVDARSSDDAAVIVVDTEELPADAAQAVATVLLPA